MRNCATESTARVAEDRRTVAGAADAVTTVTNDSVVGEVDAAEVTGGTA
jgi:hypothetical protein